ncbi:MAG: Cys-tRNA(Pro) deacylase [Desulfobacteraceae bacterium]|nr:MAG: Cys-tRNA(Pro) deacylase [Desulfobacteraceae bacterium]
MSKGISSTPAVRVLREQKAVFTLHSYRYEEKGGTAAAAKALNAEEHKVIKTLVMETDAKEPFLVLMHGDRKVSLKALAASLKIKKAVPCTPETANKHTGYFVGGISPFGIKKSLKIYMEASIASLEKIYINAGKRGLLFQITIKDLIRILNPILVNVAI